MTKRYLESEKLLERAERSIPLGTQTFSKSKTQYPFGASPYFITKAKGALVWDADGNEYIDFVNSLASITLGYNDPEVMNAVQTQLNDGVIFTLPHPIEIEVAEKIIKLVPCAEMVRFGKNGSDATSGAIRLARAFTGRDRIAVCGYHGWQDWYIGSTLRNRGVPERVRELTHPFLFNDVNSLKVLFDSYPNEFAAVIIEPMNTTYPKDGFLEKVKDLTHQNAALLIFDETITGFRFDVGGAQKLFGVTPDLATFGKGLANGFPLSAVVGSKEVMSLMEEIFFSFTFGGEALSLAAASATLDKLVNEPVVEKLISMGQKTIDGLNSIIQKNNTEDFMKISGHPTWSFLTLNDIGNYTSWHLKTILLQELFKRGILSLGTHNMSYAHTNMHIERLLEAYSEIVPIIKDAVVNNNLLEKLECAPIQPLFRVR